MLGMAIDCLPFMSEIYNSHDNSQQNLCTLDELNQLVESIHQAGNLTSFLLMIREVELSGLEALVSLAIASSNVKETLKQASELQLLRSYGVELSIADEHSAMVLICDASNQYSALIQQTIVDAAFGMLHRILNPVVKMPLGRALIQRIELISTNQQLKADYEAFFSCSVTTGATQNKIFLDRAACNSNLSSRCEPLKEQALKAIDAKTQQLQQHQSYQGKVVSLLQSCESLSDYTIEKIANQLNTSVRTLQKRLQEEACSFSQLKLRAVIERSKKLLQTDTLNVDQISDAMGFADASSFRRAFRREAGVSPTYYRKHYKNSLSTSAPKPIQSPAQTPAAES